MAFAKDHNEQMDPVLKMLIEMLPAPWMLMHPEVPDSESGQKGSVLLPLLLQRWRPGLREAARRPPYRYSLIAWTPQALPLAEKPCSFFFRSVGRCRVPDAPKSYPE